MALTFLAAVALLQGDAETTRRSVAESLELGRRLSDRRTAFTMDVLACLTAVEGGAERAVCLAGAASAIHESTGNTPPPVWDDFMSPYLQPARKALGQSEAQSAWEAGRRMDFDDAVQLAQSTVSNTLDVLGIERARRSALSTIRLKRGIARQATARRSLRGESPTTRAESQESAAAQTQPSSPSSGWVLVEWRTRAASSGSWDNSPKSNACGSVALTARQAGVG